jgi:hypothetical protein
MTWSADQERREVAALAARYIAEGGLDYGSAKSKAVRELFDGRAPRSAIPDNDEVDEALREHLELFDEGHAERVQRMREVALELMAQLAEFSPLLTGAAWKGIVSEHAPIHLQLFHDNAKEVEYWLLNRNIPFDVDTIQHFQRKPDVEALMFEWRREPVLMSIYTHDDLRGALKPGNQGPVRGDRKALLARMQEIS